MNNITPAVFEKIFFENINARSRTAKGTSDTSSSSSKKKLLLEGDALKKQVERNTAELIRCVWQFGIYFRDSTDTLTPRLIRCMVEQWYEINTHKLQKDGAYTKEFQELQKLAAALSRRYGRNYRINSYYRVWTPSYITLNIQPIDLEFFMDEFYEGVYNNIQETKSKNISHAQLLAFADLMMDGELHPWNDGCGRISTALVMWLSLVCGANALPIFGSRDEHYASIRDPEGVVAHARYFETCLERFY